MYVSRDKRRIDFRDLTGSQRTPRDWGVTEGVAQNPSREACASLEDGVLTRGPPDEYFKNLFYPHVLLRFY